MEENKKIEDSWITYLAGESDDKPDKDMLDSEAFKELQKTWELTGTTYGYRNSNPDKIWSELNEQIDAKAKVFELKRFGLFRYAAIFVALVALGSVTFLLTRTPNTVQEQLVTPFLEMKKIQTTANPSAFTTIILPDGSSVKINAKSILQYPVQFTGNIRKVILSGEAYFDIIHDAAHPFVVEINNVQVEDLGTSFNISAYPNKRVEVNVISGSVRLSDRNQKESAILIAGSNGKILKGNGNIIVTNELTPNCLSWITRELSFHHTPLAMVFEQLENIYHVHIETADPKIGEIPYTANFEKFQLEDIVNIIARTHHLSVTKRAEGFVFAQK